MTTPTSVPVDSPSTATSAPTAGWVRRHRAMLLVGGAFVAAVALAAITGGGAYSEVADPDNPDPQGARAVARVLEAEGIEVTVVRDAAAFENARMDADTTVVVTSVESLGESTARRLLEHRGPADLILVEPRHIVELFGQDRSAELLDEVRTTGDCSDLRFDDLEIEVQAGTAYPDVASSCFRVTEGALLVTPEPGLTLLGSSDLISNGQVTRADNAAVALRLLGEREHLVWYVPDSADLGAEEGVTISSLLPQWLRPGLVLATLALLTVMWWRGRRLGRLVVEPLPVVVTAIESTRSRARLYRKANDRGHAAGTLRRAARHRLCEQLNLPRTVAEDPATLIRDVARHTTHDEARLKDLLDADAPVPASDRELIRLANDLADLMREVRRS